ncbi:ABC transporter substrate-binding protein [Staphylococcus intermedius]|uniref:Iron compound ABC transporter periplasmic component n=1 Tax=Staphylococcus intermedius NCTC 11048 TaxID=1141106 RepID=A0A380GAX8_STAIN|nr:ABC transporter substrate-binding protein [Staphylococcus intermedius]PCF65592.1 ABC transporter substrate-binding protein [Staphylococcus intermedius]PCF81271.1 ABC transporter substrate-binding protein [Staphylococcus intermedius]PCF82554.1 ABC transporter substrate-binding protein [Staphylococcus intermedius]PCF87253.1 ABC transporter substrate-binding protein [Staphylococcus intermedius]PCF87814.1 ABC transporter substrate-binding protein [Staphylococcus intermedius]
MKFKWFVPVMVMVVFMLAGCNFNANQSKETGKSSDNGPERIISLMPSNTEILYELGLGDKVVGVSTVDDYPKAVKKKQQFDAMHLNKEALIKAQPDLILAHESQKASQGKVLDDLEESGIRVAYVKDAHSIDEMYETFHQIGKLTGTEQQAAQLVIETKHNIQQVIDDIPNRKKAPKVFIEIASEPEMYTAGKGTFMNDMLKQLHAQNVFDDTEGWPKVSKEQVIKKNPDVMIATSGVSTEDYRHIVQQRGGFEEVEAVKDDHVVALNDDMLSRPGPRLDDAMKLLRDAVYEK